MARLRHLLVGALLVMGYFAGLPAHLWDATAPGFVPQQASSAVPQANQDWQALAVSDGATRLVHAASLVALPDGRLRAVWFAGSREGAGDVAIHTAVFDPARGQWSPEQVLLDRATLSAGLGRYVRKLGNAVMHADADGRLRLYVVTVSFGGWGASRLSVLHSDDGGDSWSAPRLLVTTPFLNISNLVKGVPVAMTADRVGLPIYHEFLGKFGELLVLDSADRIVAKSRIGYGRGAIQPVLLVDSVEHAGVLLRNTRDDTARELWFSHSEDGGATWAPLQLSGFASPDSAAAAVVINARNWLAASNCNGQRRDDLCLKISHDQGAHWLPLHTFHDRSNQRDQIAPQQLRDALAEELANTADVANKERLLDHALKNKCARGSCEFQYDYPYLLRADNGDLHMVYTWNKTLIRHLWWRADATAQELTP